MPKVFAYAGDNGEEVAIPVSNRFKYDIAAVVRNPANGAWLVAARGWSHDSVLSRGRASARRNWGMAGVQACTLWRETAPMVRRFFGSHRVYITRVFTDGQWRSIVDSKGHVVRDGGGKDRIRYWIVNGAEAIGFTCAGNDVPAEFQAGELTRDCGFRLGR